VPVIGQEISFLIPTPSEINGNVILEGRRSEGNLGAYLRWNSKHERKISIILGLKKSDTLASIPVYRFKTRDDGEVFIPSRLLNVLQIENFEKVVVTFIRSYEGYHENGNNELLVSSQSIHSIVIDIP
jgi:hypothetical protein